MGGSLARGMLTLVTCDRRGPSEPTGPWRARFAAGKRVKGFYGIERQARLKLDRLEAATSLNDLAALPSNWFEALKGDRQGQYSIRVNDPWRICFE